MVSKKLAATHFTVEIQESGRAQISQAGNVANKPGEVIAQGLGILGELHRVSCPVGPEQVAKMSESFQES